MFSHTAAVDAWRFFTIAEGIALLLISAVSVVDAWLYAWPQRLRWGIAARWLGRFMQVIFVTIFVIRQIHKGMEWYTAFAFVSINILLLGTWLTRESEFLWYQKRKSGDRRGINHVEPL